MILITILFIIAAISIAIVVAGVAALGVAGVLVFGDVIVCVVFIVLLIKWLVNRKNKVFERGLDEIHRVFSFAKRKEI